MFHALQPKAWNIGVSLFVPVDGFGLATRMRDGVRFAGFGRDYGREAFVVGRKPGYSLLVVGDVRPFGTGFHGGVLLGRLCGVATAHAAAVQGELGRAGRGLGRPRSQDSSGAILGAWRGG